VQGMCPYLDSCQILFRFASMSDTMKEEYINNYCESDYKSILCERRISIDTVSLGVQSGDIQLQKVTF